MSEVVALVLAGGTGVRAGQDGPKQLAVLGGMTVLERAVRALDTHPRVDRVIVTMPTGLVDEARGLVPAAHVVAGGSRRQDSAAIALSHVTDDALVLIHDAARPFVTHDVVDRCLDALLTHDAVGCVAETGDTIYVVDEKPHGDELVDVPDRGRRRRAQTPQGFRCDVIRDAHRLAQEAGDEATDDCSLVLRHRPDVRVALVPGNVLNVKLTTPGDFAAARARLQDSFG